MKLLGVSLSISYAILFLPVVRVDAQAPLARRRLAYVQLGSTLYLQGGFDTQAFTAQSNALDLSSSWSTSSPPWTSLNDGPLTSHHSMVAVKPSHAAGLGDGKQGYLLAIGGMQSTTFWNTYDIQAQAWSTVASIGAAAPPYPGLEGHSAVVDPNSGYIYLVGGFLGNTTYNALTVFNPSTKTVVLYQAATAATSLTDVGAVWSSIRKTILIFGGTRAPPALPNGLDLASLQEYDPVTTTWKRMVTSGSIPSPRLDHCVAASDDGSKVVVFGGALDTKTFNQDIYILDVKTATWKQGSPASSPRTRMACGFHSGQFIAWGGSSADNRTTSMHNNIPIVYDVGTDAWTGSYYAKVSQSQTPPSSAEPSSSAGLSGGKTNLGPIIGGAAGGAVVLIGCIIGIIVVYRRKRREKLDKDEARMAASLSSDEDQHNYHKGQSPAASRPNYSPDSDIDGQHLGKMRTQDHYAAVDSLGGGRERYLGGSNATAAAFASKVGSEYYDSLQRVDDIGMPLPPQGGARLPNNQGYHQQASPSNSTPTLYQQQPYQQQRLYQQQQPFQQQQHQQFQQQQEQLYQQQHQQQQQQLYQQQQELYQQQQQQLQREQESIIHPFKPSFEDSRQSGVSNISNLAYLNHSQMSSNSPHSAQDRPGQHSVRDSITSTTYSEPRRSPRAPQTPNEYVPPPP